FEKIIENQIDGVVIVNRAGEVRYVNSAGEEMFGRKAAELVDSEFGFPLIVDDPIEIDILRPDNTKVIAEMRVVETEWEQEQAWLVSLRNITEQKQAETEIAMFRATVENATDAILIFNEDQEQIIYGNAASYELFGYDKKKELVGLELNTFWPEEVLRKWLYETRPLALSNEYIWRGEALYTRKDGTAFHASINYFPILQDEESHSFFTAAIIRDITSQKQAEISLRTAKEDAEVANKAKSAFLATMSHELRTPLTAIIGYSELLKEDAILYDYREMIPDLEHIYAAGNQLLSIINDILDISKIEAGKFEFQLDAVAVLPVVEECLLTIAPNAEKKGLDLRWHLEENIPSVRIDRARLVQVLNNLVSNAVKFTDTGSVTVQARAQDRSDFHDLPFSLAENVATWLHISIIDTGIGIADENRELIFDNFRQVDNSYSRRFNGTGLGLAITRRLLQMMGGYIWVESTLHEGSTFHVLLPAEKDPPTIKWE
ncbi:MAG: PAS domain S-box protein, partial [Candidatus Lokiarchaeota archaeon]|nr:PAS domain S-box protein [Candidatus Lokiarchaeota archaeon]